MIIRASYTKSKLQSKLVGKNQIDVEVEEVEEKDQEERPTMTEQRKSKRK